ncbi:MAG: hypothetical protein U1D66_12540 [Erythrobacter sp.]|nr:hypothetical protein [Erythrobacter sp.]
MDGDLLALPWQIQLALASGYASYSIAYIGVRSHHTATDTLFRSLVFSTITIAAINYLPISQVWALLSASVFLTLGAGVGWRMFGRDTAKRILRHFNVSWTDDTPTAWKTITADNSRYFVTQVAVELTNGQWLICSRLSDFHHSPFAPCTFGLDGDIALYVDTEIDADGTETQNESVIDSQFGDRLTYIPASSVKRVSIRYLKANLDGQVAASELGSETGRATLVD